MMMTKKHVDHVLEECAKKMGKDMTSNWRNDGTNAYLKAHAVWVNEFKEQSATF
jgi:hypothetical protein